MLSLFIRIIVASSLGHTTHLAICSWPQECSGYGLHLVEPALKPMRKVGCSRGICARLHQWACLASPLLEHVRFAQG